MQLNSLNIIFEITRRCNLHCEHCLRGDAEPKTATPKVREAVWKFVNYLDDCKLVTPSVCFTGGEPMLVAKQIYDMVERMSTYIRYDITTNGRTWNKYVGYLLNAIFSDPWAESSIKISDDQFHKKEGRVLDQWWEQIDLIGKDQIYIKSDKLHNQYILPKGRAVDNGLGWDNIYRRQDKRFNINVFGDIYDNCNMSYDSQREIVPLGTIFDHYDDLMAIAYKVGELEEEDEESII
jgi:organic radical activating enzyme